MPHGVEQNRGERTALCSRGTWARAGTGLEAALAASPSRGRRGRKGELPWEEARDLSSILGMGRAALGSARDGIKLLQRVFFFIEKQHQGSQQQPGLGCDCCMPSAWGCGAWSCSWRDGNRGTATPQGRDVSFSCCPWALPPHRGRDMSPSPCPLPPTWCHTQQNGSSGPPTHGCNGPPVKKKKKKGP